MRILLMGVTGCGKTTVGRLLAARLGGTFHDADDFHPPANVAKMSAGLPLSDADRRPWLERLRAALEAWTQEGRTAVLACSALRAAYRRALLENLPDARLVYLRGSRELIAARLNERKDHFMPPALLESQFAALEEPGPGEGALVAEIQPPPDALAEWIARNIRAD